MRRSRTRERSSRQRTCRPLSEIRHKHRSQCRAAEMNESSNFATWAMQGDDKAPFVASGDGRKLSYGDMRAATANYARALVKLGVRPGDRVAVQVEKSVEAIFLYLACLRAGAVYLPLNGAYTRAEL